MSQFKELITIELINSIGKLRSFHDRDEAGRDPEMDWAESTAEKIEKLFNSQYVPFVSEVEEFNSLMNKPNNYVPFKLVYLKSAPFKSVPFKSAPLKSVLLHLTPLRLTYFKSMSSLSASFNVFKRVLFSHVCSNKTFSKIFFIVIFILLILFSETHFSYFLVEIESIKDNCNALINSRHCDSDNVTLIT